MNWLDSLTETSTRSIARLTSRRSFLAALGGVLMGASALPLLPVARGAAAAEGTDAKGKLNDDPSCCGGSQSVCPPGTEMSPVTWIGTCQNPADGRNYAISYNDCCGKSSCGRCFCNRNERDTPLYIPFQSNDYNWC